MSWRVDHGECLDVLRAIPDASVDAVCTDPPYGISFMGADWDQPGYMVESVEGEPSGQNRRRNPAPSGIGRNGMALEAGRYDLSRTANQTFQAWVQAWAAECYRVLKPGGHLLSFGSTRTYHRLAAGVEDAGFEIRDQLAWMFGGGFPKSHNVDRLRGTTFCGCEDGGEALPEYELRGVRGGHLPPTLGARTEREDVLQQGLSEHGLQGDGAVPDEGPADGAEPGVEGRGHVQEGEGELPGRPLREGALVGAADGALGRLPVGTQAGTRVGGEAPADAVGGRPPSRPRPAEQRPAQPGAVADERRPQARRGRPICGRCRLPMVPAGLGTALKPAFEPVVVARKHLVGTVAYNLIEYGLGTLSVDDCRIAFLSEEDEREAKAKNQHADFGTPPGGNAVYGDYSMVERENYDPEGRWPANVLLDEEAAALVGAPARFFYVAKASRAEREAGCEGLPARRFAQSDGGQTDVAGDAGDERYANQSIGLNKVKVLHNYHPTVKPVSLMRWLVRLVTRPGQTVLDPFCGSGTTGIACVLEDRDFVGIEREPTRADGEDYVAIANARLAFWAEHGEAALDVVRTRAESDRREAELRDMGQIAMEL